MDSIMYATLNGTTIAGGPEVLRGLMRKHFVKAFDESLDSFPALAKLTGVDLATKILGEAEVTFNSLHKRAEVLRRSWGMVVLTDAKR